VDDEWARRGMENVGAWILGRNMFGPVRGPWPDESWKGWWGEEPPYHVPTFVLTHHPRKAVEMKGGTTFHFVTDGIHSALQRAKDAAKDKDVRIGGGVATIQQYLRTKLIDELHLAFSPILMGSGENLFTGTTWRRSATHARNTFPPSMRCTFFCKNRLDPSLSMRPIAPQIDFTRRSRYAFPSAKGRIQSAERAVPTLNEN
jgi:dihydrofolate reductase